MAKITYTTMSEFRAADVKIRKRLAGAVGAYLAHVRASVEFFHAGGNHSVQILNDLLDTATAGKLPRNRIIDWLSPVVGHETLKEGRTYLFGKKIKGADYGDLSGKVADHFKVFPSWEEFKKEKAPDSFSADEEVAAVVAYLKKRAKVCRSNNAGALADKLERQAIALAKSAAASTPARLRDAAAGAVA